MKTTFRRIARALLALGLICAGSGILLSQTPSVLKEMAVQKEGTRLHILFKTEGTYAVEASFLPSPPRLIVIMSPISGIQVQPFTQIGDTGVADVRTGQAPPDKAQIVFDLEANVPAYGITQSPEGLKISFWYEEAPSIPAAVAAEPVRPAAQAVPAAPAAPTAPGRSGFFLAGRAGLSIFPGSDLSVQKTFDLYGETATLDEAYSFSPIPAFELQFGKYFGRTKVGLGVGYCSLKQPGTFTASLPHPFLTGSPRAVTFESADLKNTVLEFSAFALFSIMDTEKIALSAGPMIGVNLGAMQSLEDFNFTEESPYDAAGVTVTDMTYVEDKFTEFSLGIVLNLEYRLNEGLSLLFDARAVYLNPKNPTLGQRANLLHLQPVLGIQYNF